MPESHLATLRALPKPVFNQPLDERVSDAYCRIVSDIALVTIQSRDVAHTALSANTLWQALCVTDERSVLLWQIYYRTIAQLVQSFTESLAGAQHDPVVLGAYLRLKQFLIDGAPFCRIAQSESSGNEHVNARFLQQYDTFFTLTRLPHSKRAART